MASERRGVLSEREREEFERIGGHDTWLADVERAVLLAAARRLSQLFFKGSQADVRARFAGRILRSWAKELRDGK